MMISRVAIYSEGNSGYVRKADVYCEHVTLWGLRLVTEGEHLTALVRPQWQTAAGFLRDRAAMERFVRAIHSRLDAFLRRNVRLLLDQQEVGVLSQEEMAEGAERVWFRKAGEGDAAAYYANATTIDRIAISGIRIAQTGENAFSLRMPDADEVEKTGTIIRDRDAWNEVFAAVRREFEGVPAEKTVQPVEEPKQEATAAEDSKPAVPVRPEAAEPVNMENDSQDTQAPKTVEGRDHNRYGRIKNAKDAGLLRHTSGNVVRPVAMIEQMKQQKRYRPEKARPDDLIAALSNGTISIIDLEILSYVAKFRFITSAMLTDLYSGGYITSETQTKRYTQTKLNDRLSMLNKHHLITSCRFIQVDEQGNLDFDRISVGQIHVLSQSGGLLLRDLGREATAQAFDVYQDGRTARDRLCVNQWVVYWLSAYPEVVSMQFGFNQVAFGLREQLNGARIPAWVYVGDQMLIGQPARRCDERDRQNAQEEMINKIHRVDSLFGDLEHVYSFDGDDYIPMSLKKRPIIQYVCEDQEHMQETAGLLLAQQLNGQEIWLTYDQRLFNYEFEGKRFWRLDGNHEPQWIDPGAVFGIGEERKEEKRLDREQPVS